MTHPFLAFPADTPNTARRLPASKPKMAPEKKWPPKKMAGEIWRGKSGEMAGVTGLEPAASGVTGRRSNQLSYTPFAKGQASMPDAGQN